MYKVPHSFTGDKRKSLQSGMQNVRKLGLRRGCESNGPISPRKRSGNLTKFFPRSPEGSLLLRLASPQPGHVLKNFSSFEGYSEHLNRNLSVAYIPKPVMEPGRVNLNVLAVVYLAQ